MKDQIFLSYLKYYAIIFFQLLLLNFTVLLS